jgi:hypothetical protein
MAIVTLNPMLQSVSGRLGNIVFYHRYGKEYARVYVKPFNPDTESQRFIRKTFGSAVKSWQELPFTEKDKYKRKARRLAMSGYNLFISLYMKDNITLKNTGQAEPGLLIASSGYPQSIIKASCSVSVPISLKSSLNYPLMHPFPSYGTG